MYLITTNHGNLYYIDGSKNLKLLEYPTKSIYTGDNSLRFIKQIKDGYLIGTSEELLIFKTTYKPDVVKRFSLPGLVDIKDVVIGVNFIAMLSGLRDSVYILDKDLKNVHICFNFNKMSELEFFKDRQKQCNEINSMFFQVFYCPPMNNFWRFNQLRLENNSLRVISESCCIGHNSFLVNLNDFSYKQEEYIDLSLKFKIPKFNVNLQDELITDYIEI